jgi:tetratricopeptide (TPR) repeat protein
VLGDLATVHLRSGSPEQALPLAIESRAIQREVGNREGEALALAIQGYAELGLGNLDRAREALTESTAVAHRLGYLHGLVFSLNGLAALAFRSGDAERARHLFEAAQALRESIGIEHDPDDALVAGDREAAGHTANGASGDFDLERVVEVALAG